MNIMNALQTMNNSVSMDISGIDNPIPLTRQYAIAGYFIQVQRKRCSNFHFFVQAKKGSTYIEILRRENLICRRRNGDGSTKTLAFYKGIARQSF